MGPNSRNVRYYYWLLVEFVKKHLKLIFLSALISSIFIISSITISPYLVNLLTPQNTVIGLVGSYTFDTLPDEILLKISNGLLFINEKGKPIPILAESWEIVEKGLVYRFHLKKNILMDDGTFFTARDINYRFRDVTTRLKGDYLIEFVLNKPLAIFPFYLTKPIVKYPHQGIGGLYKIDRYKYRYDKLIELSISPNKKDLSRISYKFYPSEAQMINAYKLGQITQMTLSKKSIADVFLQWKNSKVEKVVDYSNLLTLFFNYNNQFLKEKEVRGAIKIGIDRGQFADLGATARTSVPPSSWAYQKNSKLPVYDAELGQKIIRKFREATDSAKLNFNTYYDYLDIAGDINKNLNELGIPTNLNVMSYSNSNDFDILLTYLKIAPDPDQYYYWHSTQSLSQATGYRNLKVDKILEDGRSTFDQEERIKFYYDLQKNLDDDNTAVFIYFPYTYTIKRI
jgi:peptide/nickel transport system substrate-binding protein